jgi:hypothetical protein
MTIMIVTARECAQGPRSRVYADSTLVRIITGMAKLPKPAVPLFIRRLLPGADEEELQQAAETFRQYMVVVRGIYQRIKQERSAADSREAGEHDRFETFDHVV